MSRPEFHKRRSLPRRARGLIRCAALDGNGFQCQAKADVVDRYHGDNEMYGYDADRGPSWVEVRLCRKHAPRTAEELGL